MSSARAGLRLFTPRRMCDVRTMIVAHSVQFSGEPAELGSLFETNAAARTGDRVTRSDHQLRPPAMRTAAGQRAFSYRAAKLLNDINADIRRLNPAGYKRAQRSLNTVRRKVMKCSKETTNTIR